MYFYMLMVFTAIISRSQSFVGFALNLRLLTSPGIKSLTLFARLIAFNLFPVFLSFLYLFCLSRSLEFNNTPILHANVRNDSLFCRYTCSTSLFDCSIYLLLPASSSHLQCCANILPSFLFNLLRIACCTGCFDACISAHLRMIGYEENQVSCVVFFNSLTMHSYP